MQIIASDVLIRHADRVIVANLLFDAEVCLLHAGVLEMLIEDENRRLRAENKRLQMERDILKKATAFFAAEAL